MTSGAKQAQISSEREKVRPWKYLVTFIFTETLIQIRAFDFGPSILSLQVWAFEFEPLSRAFAFEPPSSSLSSLRLCLLENLQQLFSQVGVTSDVTHRQKNLNKKTPLLRMEQKLIILSECGIFSIRCFLNKELTPSLWIDILNRFIISLPYLLSCLDIFVMLHFVPFVRFRRSWSRLVTYALTLLCWVVQP